PASAHNAVFQTKAQRREAKARRSRRPVAGAHLYDPWLAEVVAIFHLRQSHFFQHSEDLFNSSCVQIFQGMRDPFAGHAGEPEPAVVEIELKERAALCIEELSID